MQRKIHRPAIAVGSSVIFALSLSACGSGGASGGVASTPAPPAAPVSVTPPTPTPPPPPPVAASVSNIDTAEYRASDGPSYHGAATAYQAGATGKGVTVGIVDTGIDTTSHEFTGRISGQSADVTSANRGVSDNDGHGTVVARVLAGAKDDRDTHGIAFNATILALRADTAGSCTDVAGNCGFGDNDIAAGVNRATDAGARVINLSLGGTGGINSTLRNAIQRATKAGIVVVVSAGNEGNKSSPEFDPSNPSPFAQALLANGNGLVIIATSVNESGGFSAFSNRAGSSSNAVLSALGESVCCVYENDAIKTMKRNGVNYTSQYNGTSFSAPQIAGAAALLAQAFPNLTGAQIVSLLLDSAKDAGTAGTDTTYGRGILDIAKAFAPSGKTSFASTITSVPSSSGTTSGAMGDSGGGAKTTNAVITDGYGRAYEIDLGEGLAANAPRRKLAPALTDQGHYVEANAGKAVVAFSISASGPASGTLSPLSLEDGEGEMARILAGRITSAIAGDTQFSLGIRESAAAQLNALQQIGGSGSFLAAGSARNETGFDRRPDMALALRREFGSYGVTATVENGEAQLYENKADQLRDGYQLYPYAGFGVALDRQIGPVRAAFGVDVLNEKQTVLGARFADFIGNGGANSLFANANAEAELGMGWTLGANWRQGWTWANKANAATGGKLTSNAFSFDIAKAGALAGNDRLAFRLSQPLRVTGGGLSLYLPVAYDYDTSSATFGNRPFNLAPKGREIASELSWGIPLRRGYFSTNIYWRQEPGHFENAPSDIGAAFRFNVGF